MKKIMFNDKYGLTNAVLEGRKTMTRRLVQSDNIVSITTSDGAVHHVDKTFGSYHEYMDKDGKVWLAWCPYKVGEEVAVAQNYKNLAGQSLKSGFIGDNIDYQIHFKNHKGWNNKMFVRADLMPHRIRITDIKIKRLQDISDEDCLCEGVTKGKFNDFPHDMYFPYKGCKDSEVRYTARAAFAALIDKVSGKGTWQANPWVFAYEFELVK